MRIWNRLFTGVLFFYAISSEAHFPRDFANNTQSIDTSSFLHHLNTSPYKENSAESSPVTIAQTLLSPQTHSLHPLLSSKNYATLLELNDLSYVIAKIHTFTDQPSLTASGQKQLIALTMRLDQYYQTLNNAGREGFNLPIGATGVRNQEADPSCIIAVNRLEHLIIVTFHGSRSGSPLWNKGNGDWGANLDLGVELGINLGISHMNRDIEIHRGFGNNFQSVQANLNVSLSDILDQFSPEELQQTWVWMNGHSKGGALASLAAPSVKKYFQSKRRKHLKGVNVGAFLFSSPRVFHGDHSQNWAQQIVGKENIFRINVEGDPVTAVPTYSYHGFRSIGMLFLDHIAAVNRRASVFYNTYVSGWFDLNAWMGYHYVSNLRMRILPNLSQMDSQEFDPNIVLPYEYLNTAYLDGQHHEIDFQPVRSVSIEEID